MPTLQQPLLPVYVANIQCTLDVATGQRGLFFFVKDLNSKCSCLANHICRLGKEVLQSDYTTLLHLYELEL